MFDMEGNQNLPKTREMFSMNMLPENHFENHIAYSIYLLRYRESRQQLIRTITTKQN